jgi:anti-anti-sigma factor
MQLQPRERFFEVNTVGDVKWVRFTEEDLGDRHIHAIGEQLFLLADDVGKHKLHLDFGKVNFLTGGGLGKLITLHKKVERAGSQLALCNVDARLYEVFEVTRLTQILDVRPKRDSVGAS